MSNFNSNFLIRPDWPAPEQIKAYTTLRQGGVSQPPFDHFNLAKHVGDFADHVGINRDKLQSLLQLPAEPIWINQTHSTIAVKALPENRMCEADATFTNEKNQVCVVLTADCLPILICNRQGTHVAAIHAGWRGLLNGVIENTSLGLKKLDIQDELLAWLGPAIGPTHFEVGEEVYTAFISHDPEAKNAFVTTKNKKWLANLYTLAKLRLQKCGVNAIYGGELCTFSDPERFYSYRRDGSKTGRMATLIWIADNNS